MLGAPGLRGGRDCGLQPGLLSGLSESQLSAVCWAVSQQLPQGFADSQALMLSGIHTLTLLSPSCSVWETEAPPVAFMA